MKYIPLNKFPEYDENPFMENALQEINRRSIKKKVFVKGNRSVLNQVINDNGEIVAHSAFLRTIEVDESQFIKVYLSRFAAFYDLSKAAMKVFGYILTKCVIPNKDILYIDYDEAKNFTRYSANNIIRTGLSCLVEQGIIARFLTPFINLTTKQDKMLPLFCVFDLLQDLEGSYLHNSGEDFHVRFVF